MTTRYHFSAVLALGALLLPVSALAAILFQEEFEDSKLSARGWYDNTNQRLSDREHIPGSNRSLEFHFDYGARVPAAGAGMRHKFPATEFVLVSYYVKYSANWEGSNKPYHPHEFSILTNADDDWIGPAYTHLTLYIEQNEGTPLLAIQDGRNIDQTKINVSLTQVTEDRSIAGCNGDSDGHGHGECYKSGDFYFNGKKWKADRICFEDVPGKYFKNDWHFIEAYFQLNHIRDGKGVPDGVIKYWFDGRLMISHEDVMFRTGRQPTLKFNQLLIAPYIGDGSPVRAGQTFWVDRLTVATARPPGKDRIAVERVGPDVLLSWPASSIDYTLQSAESSFLNWVNVDLPWTLGNGTKTVTIQPADHPRFFRLATE